MTATVAEPELLDAEDQARDIEDVRRLAQAGIATEWQRVWDLPLPFFQEKYESAGLDRGAVPPLEEIPAFRKEELRDDQERRPPWGGFRSVDLEHAMRVSVSTGTTGKPFMSFFGPGEVGFHQQVVKRNYWRAGMRAGTRLASCWPGGLYAGASLTSTTFESGILEVAVGPPFTVDMARGHLETFKLLRPTAFMLTSSQLQIYEQAAREAGIDLRELTDGAPALFLEASCQFEDARRRWEHAYGLRVFNIGGVSEFAGCFVCDCVHHQGLHVPGDHFAIQVCDPHSLREVPDGERGTLVISAFGLETFGLRFDTEDIVVRHSGVCACGETGPRYTLIGRGADAQRIGDRLVLPLDVQLALVEHESPECQVVPAQDDGVLRVKVEGEDAGGGPAIADHLAGELGARVEVEIVAPGSLPRSTFKPRRV